MASLNEASHGISQPLTLPCGLTIRNRLAKAALGEWWSTENNLPSNHLIRAYDAWANGGWGFIITGNVMIDAAHLGQPTDCAVNSANLEEETLASWRQWSEECNRTGTPIIMQLNHPGRQSPLGAGTRGYLAKTIAPSAIPLNIGDGLMPWALGKLIFGTPRRMTTDDIRHVVAQFANAARLAAEAGFSGVEIHAAHGYLLSQFLSAKSNQRGDEYGGSALNRVKIVIEVIQAIREVVPAQFCVGIKFNSVDHQSQNELHECIEQLKAIQATGIDFLEISGGTWENLSMIHGKGSQVQESAVSARTSAREAFFLDFATAIRSHLKGTPLMVTGGFRSRKGMDAALRQSDCDLIGLGRPSILSPAFPKHVLLNAEVDDSEAHLSTKPVEVPWLLKHCGCKFLSEGIESAWYVKQMRKTLVV